MILSGETPVRQEYKYPRVCAQTSPMERLVERFRSVEGAKDPNESMTFSDEVSGEILLTFSVQCLHHMTLSSFLTGE